MTLSADLDNFFETKSKKITFIWKLVGWEWGEPNFFRIFFETKAKKSTVIWNWWW